jgi:hypothetical protein
MPDWTLFRWAKVSCRKKFTSVSWGLNHIKLHNPEHLQVARQKNLTIGSAPRHVEPAKRREFNFNKDSVYELNEFPNLEHVENITESASQPSPPSLPGTETYAGGGAPLSEYIAEICERDALGSLETNQQNNHYYPFAMREEYIYMQCGMKKKGMKTYYDNVLKEEITSAKKFYVRAEWLRQSGRGPSEPSETPRWRITPCPASIQRVALYLALRSLFHCIFAFCQSPILNDHSGVVAKSDNTSEWVPWVCTCIGIAMRWVTP